MAQHRTWSIAMTLLFAAAPLGCATSVFSGSLTGYDAQGCAEDALRRRPSATVVSEAARLFTAGCGDGDAAACSALGVLHELGLGVPRNEDRARALFAQACAGENQRGCTNLAHAELARPGSQTDTARAHALLTHACDRGEPSACASMGKRLALGMGVPRSAARAEPMLTMACDSGRAEACFDLAELGASAVRADAPSVTATLAKACGGGFDLACQRLEGHPIASR